MPPSRAFTIDGGQGWDILPKADPKSRAVLPQERLPLSTMLC